MFWFVQPNISFLWAVYIYALIPQNHNFQYIYNIYILIETVYSLPFGGGAGLPGGEPSMGEVGQNFNNFTVMCRQFYENWQIGNPCKKITAIVTELELHWPFFKASKLCFRDSKKVHVSKNPSQAIIIKPHPSSPPLLKIRWNMVKDGEILWNNGVWMC